jgi:hypothetical protein
MRLRRLIGYSAAAITCLFSSGCFSFEQEIFLRADGSGEFVLYISMPDLPEEMKKGGTPAKDPSQGLAEFKKEVLEGAPPTLKLKQVKELKQNGAHGLIAIFEFKDLKDVTAALSNVGKGMLQEGEVKGNSLWSVALDRRGGKNRFTGKFLVDLQEKKPEKPVAPAKPEEAGKAELKIEGLEEQLMPLMLGTVRMRFVLHAPAPITQTNADIVLQERTAVWNCTLAAFAKNKKPIEMTAIY